MEKTFQNIFNRTDFQPVKIFFLLKTCFKPFKPTFCNKVASHIKKRPFRLAFTGDKCFIFAHQL